MQFLRPDRLTTLFGRTAPLAQVRRAAFTDGMRAFYPALMAAFVLLRALL